MLQVYRTPKPWEGGKEKQLCQAMGSDRGRGHSDCLPNHGWMVVVGRVREPFPSFLFVLKIIFLGFVLCFKKVWGPLLLVHFRICDCICIFCF